MSPLNRKVKQIQPEKENLNKVEYFSEFLSYPVVVLLGDPGAGKTYLLNEARREEGGKFFKAKLFCVHAESSIKDSIVYIDGLDEKRSRLSTGSSIDEIVKILLQYPPAKLRISCRSLEWLGNADISLFEPIFASIGLRAIIQLEPLSDAEQIAVLESVNQPDPQGFMAMAQAKGVGVLTQNPLTLKMLQKTVLSHSWPTSKKQLYEASVDILIEEHSQNIKLAHSEYVNFSSEELLDASGLICASQLIADIEGIGLLPYMQENSYPSYTNFGRLGCNTAIVGAALQRRLFVATEDQVACCIHRTFEEFMAARWLAHQVDNKGFPLTRLMGLICIENKPALELRGLYAWLAVFLQYKNLELVENDPLAVLGGGDPISLPSSVKQRLLASMQRYANENPAFEYNQDDLALGALCCLENAEELRLIINSKQAPLKLRVLILQSIAHGVPLPGLYPDLVSILLNKQTEYIARLEAVDALINAAHVYLGNFADLSKKNLGSDSDAIRLRAYIIRRLYSESFSWEDIFQLLKLHMESCKAEIYGELYDLKYLPSEEEIITILDRLVEYTDGLADSLNSEETCELLRSWVAKLLDGLVQVDVPSLWKWLSTINKLNTLEYQPHRHELTAAIKNRQGLLSQLYTYCLSNFNGQEIYRAIDHFERVTLSHIPPAEQVPLLFDLCRNHSVNKSLQESIFGRLTYWIFSSDNDDHGWVDEAYALTRLSPSLQPISEVENHCLLEGNWRRRDYLRNQEVNLKSEAARFKNYEIFDANEDLVLDGSHFEILIFVAKKYLNYSGERNVPRKRYDRLVCALGEGRAESAAYGLERFLALNENIPDVSEILDYKNKSQLWLVLMAAVDAIWERTKSLATISTLALKAALAINFYERFYDPGNGSNSLVASHFEWIECFISQDPKASLEVISQCVENDILHLPESGITLGYLTQFYSAECTAKICLGFIKKYRNLKYGTLKLLLPKIFRDSGVKVELKEFLVNSLSQGGRDNEVEELLRIYNFLFFCEVEADPPNLQAGGLGIESISRFSEVIFTVGQTIKESAVSLISSAQLKNLIFEIGNAIGAEANLEGNEKDDDEGVLVENDSDSNRRFLIYLVEMLANRIDDQSVQFLESLIADKALEMFNEDFCWYREKQLMLRRKQLFKQPTWDQTLSVLKNGPPINVSDLLYFVVDHIESLQKEISCSNVDLYKQFWNEDEFSHVKEPKVEESARDVLVQLLRPRMLAHGIRVEPEGHMVKDKRADIVVSNINFFLPVELKRDAHPNVWTAWREQLDKLYTTNPEADGHGLYLVFWYGAKRAGSMPKPHGGFESPNTAGQMASIFQSLIPEPDKKRLKVIVLDVSGGVGTKDNTSEVANKIKEHFEQQRSFLSSNIKIADLAASIDEQEQDVNQAIVGVLKFKNFRAMVENYRIEHAKKLLKDPGCKSVEMESIAKDCGFRTVNSFGTAFKKLIGKTPKQYRIA